MPTYTTDNLVAILGAVNQIEAQINKLESALAAATVDEYLKPGRDFIIEMGHLHQALSDMMEVYRSSIIKAEAIINPAPGSETIFVG